jgi:hypothetical protein
VQLAAKPWRKKVALAGAYKIEEASRPSPEPDIYFPHRLGVRSAPRRNQNDSVLVVRFGVRRRLIFEKQEIYIWRMTRQSMMGENAARFYSALHRFAVSLTRNESDAAEKLFLWNLV